MKFFNLLILPSFLVLTACQQLPVEQTTNMPVVIIDTDIDSDADGVLDSKDQCPNTPYDVVVDEIGCPREPEIIIEQRTEYRAFYDKDGNYPKDKRYLNELEKIADKLKQYPNAVISLEGHASKFENDKNGKGISHERVVVLKQLLIENYGVAENQIEISSYGDQRPLADNATKEGRNMNQRVYGVITGKK